MLQLIHISKQYKTGELVQQALDGVSFSLRDNEFVSILGPSGSGKTTLLNIIGGLDRYDEGDLIINGVSTRDYKNKDWDAYRNHTIGFVFQSYNLIPHQSILSNVELALTIGGAPVRDRRKKARAALEAVGLGDQVHKKPNQLSGGQMQRVAIARALVNDPDILLADEPTGALDSETSVQIMDLLKEVARDRLVVMVTHNAELAQEYSTRIITLRDGRVMSDSHPVDFGTVGELPQGSISAAEAAEPQTAAATEDAPGTVQERAADGSAESPEKLPQRKGTAAGDAKLRAEKNDIISETAMESHPAGPEQKGGESEKKKTPGTTKKKARMSFWTSLALSANNLRSKKGRTILISLASSIGIIGIALILSISNGVNNYILNIQKETMSSYPLTISAQTIDLNGIMNDRSSMRDQMMDLLGANDTEDDGQVHTDYSNMEASETFASSMVVNNLTEFKKYLDDPEGEIHQYLGENGIVYTYDVAFDVYTYDPAGNLQNTNASVSDITDTTNPFASMMSSSFSFMRANFSSFQSGAYSSAYNFSEIASGGQNQPVSQVIKDSYDLVYGAWPEAYNEVVIILNKNNTLEAETLYQLGLMEGSAYKQSAELVEQGEKPADQSWSYEELLGRSFYLVTASDHYRQEEDGTFTYLEDTVMNQDALMENAIELKVTGIIRLNDENTTPILSTAVGYTAGLTDYCITHSEESAVIKAQEAQPEINILTGLKFDADSDEQKIADAIEYIRTLSLEEKAQLYTMITYYETDEEMGTGMLTEGSSMSDLMDMFGLSANSDMADMMQLAQTFGGDYLDSMFSNISSLLTDESQQAALLDQWLEDDPDPEILLALYDQYLVGGSYEENMRSFGQVSVDAPTSINIYTDTFEDKDQVTALIDAYNEQADSEYQIVYTDYIALLTTSMTSIVNAISYVLIAFVAISLIVSCIMIGIITHISVLERTKEIGILRAMGASRRNISHVFNAETVIIGLISGLLGVLIAILLSVPINLLLSVLLGRGMITVELPALSGFVLIAISVAVTVLGGLIPAARASRKDPVIALRTE